MYQTLSSLNAALARSEREHANAIKKGFHGDLSESTKRKYRKGAPAAQRKMIEARAERREFIEAQRMKRGLPAR